MTGALKYRPAIAEDVEAMLDLGEEMHKALRLDRIGPPDREVMGNFLHSLLGDRGFVGVVEDASDEIVGT